MKDIKQFNLPPIDIEQVLIDDDGQEFTFRDVLNLVYNATGVTDIVKGNLNG